MNELKKKAENKGINDHFIFQVAQKRMEFHNVDISYWLLVFIVTLCTNPAMAVQWIHTLNKMYKKNDCKQVNFDMLCSLAMDLLMVFQLKMNTKDFGMHKKVMGH